MLVHLGRKKYYKWCCVKCYASRIQTIISSWYNGLMYVCALRPVYLMGLGLLDTEGNMKIFLYSDWWLFVISKLWAHVLKIPAIFMCKHIPGCARLVAILAPLQPALFHVGSSPRLWFNLQECISDIHLGRFESVCNYLSSVVLRPDRLPQWLFRSPILV